MKKMFLFMIIGLIGLTNVLAFHTDDQVSIIGDNEVVYGQGVQLQVGASGIEDKNWDKCEYRYRMNGEDTYNSFMIPVPEDGMPASIIGTFYPTKAGMNEFMATITCFEYDDDRMMIDRYGQDWSTHTIMARENILCETDDAQIMIDDVTQRQDDVVIQYTVENNNCESIDKSVQVMVSDEMIHNVIDIDKLPPGRSFTNEIVLENTKLDYVVPLGTPRLELVLSGVDVRSGLYV
jgi:hypothetical protein